MRDQLAKACRLFSPDINAGKLLGFDSLPVSAFLLSELGLALALPCDGLARLKRVVCVSSMWLPGWFFRVMASQPIFVAASSRRVFNIIGRFSDCIIESTYPSIIPARICDAGKSAFYSMCSSILTVNSLPNASPTPSLRICVLSQASNIQAHPIGFGGCPFSTDQPPTPLFQSSL